MGYKLYYKSLVTLGGAEGSDWERVGRDTGNVLFLVLVVRSALYRWIHSGDSHCYVHAFTVTFTLRMCKLLHTHVVSIKKLKGETFHSNFSICYSAENSSSSLKNNRFEVFQPNLNRKVNFSLLR